MEVQFEIENIKDKTPEDKREINKDNEKPNNNLTEQDKIKLKKKSVSFWMLQYAFSSGCDVVIVILAILTSIGAGVSFSLFDLMTGWAIISISSRTLNDSTINFMQNVGNYCLYFVYIGIGALVMSSLFSFLWSYNGKIIVRRIKEEYFRIIMRQEQGWFDVNNPYEFASKVQSQTKTIENGLGMKIGTLICSLTLATTSIIVAIITCWKLTLVLMSFYPFLVFCALMMGKVSKEGGEKNREAFQAAGSIAEEVIYNIKTVSSFGNYEFEKERFNQKLNDSLRAGIKRALSNGIVFGIFGLLMVFTYTLGVWYGSRLIVLKETNFSGKLIEGGDVQIVLNCIIFSSYSLGDCTPNIKAISEACGAASDFFSLRERVPKINVTGPGLKPSKDSIQGRVVFENVSFAYPSKPDRLILKELSIEFQPGQSTAIIGASGSGKSTTIYLIQRLYEVTKGRILIDEIDLKAFDLEYLRSLIGYVPQEPILFNRSIRDNIIFGRENITEEMLLEACRKANIPEFVEKMEHGLESIVGVKGSKLSGGQKQRIAIARAILTQPKFLILDEATSALDNTSEKEVQAALNTVSKGITTFIIAHRLSTIINANKIIVLSEGKIIEAGSHQELLKLNQYYSSLIKSQITQIETDEVRNEKEELNPNEIIMNEIDVSPTKTNRSRNEVEEVLKTEQVLIVKQNKSKSHDAPNKNYSQIHHNELKKTTSLIEMSVNENLEKKREVIKVAEKSKKKLFEMMSERKGLLVMAIISSTIIGALWPMFGLLIGFSIDALSSPDPQVVEENGFLFAMYYIILAIVNGLAGFFQNYSYESIGETLTTKLRELTFIKFLRLHMGYFDVPENSPGALMSKLSTDTANLNGVVLSVVGVLTQTIVTTIVALIIGFIYDWRITLINVGFIPLLIGASMFYFKIQEGSSADNAVEALCGNLLSESVCNTKSIFTYNMQDKIVKMYHDLFEEEYKNLSKSVFCNGIFFGVSQFIMYGCFASVFYASGSFIFNNSLTLRNFLIAFFAVVMSTFMIGMSQKYVSDMSKANESLHSLFTTLNLESTIDPMNLEESYNNFRPSTIEGRIEFRNVSFSYPSRKGEIFRNLNFTIPAGKSAAFVGFSGSGKSTVIQLLERFYDVTAGEILIDNVDIRKYDIVTLRKFISLVGQEPVLFKRSIAENIRYGKLDANLEEVKRVAAKAKISSKIEGEDVNVSGGEKQRVAIARAMIRDPKILLLDEATSALDKKIEEEVQKSLEEAMEGRTSIVIAHRLSTIEKCDIIFLMENGRIIEQGSHWELIELKGKYYELHNSSQTQ